MEKVGAEGLADAEQLLCVNGGLVVDALQGARADADTVGKPLVIMALPPQFLADKMSYMYLHGDCYLCNMLPAPWILSDDHRQKRRRAISSPNCGRGIPLKGKTKTLAYRQAFLFVIL